MFLISTVAMIFVLLPCQIIPFTTVPFVLPDLIIIIFPVIFMFILIFLRAGNG